MEQVYAFSPDLTPETPGVRYAGFFPAHFLVRSRQTEGNAVLHEVKVFCELCSSQEACEHVRSLLERFGVEDTSPDGIVRFYREWLAPRKRLNEGLYTALTMEVPAREYGRTNAYTVSFLVIPHEQSYTVVCSCRGFSYRGLKKARENGLMLCTHAASAIAAVNKAEFLSEHLKRSLESQGPPEKIYLDRYQTNALMLSAAGETESKISLVQRTVESPQNRAEKESLRDLFSSQVLGQSTLQTLSQRGIAVAQSQELFLGKHFVRADKMPATEHQKAIMEKLRIAEKSVQVLRIQGRALRPNPNRETASQPQAYHIIRTYADKEGLSYRNLIRNEVLPPLPRVRFEIELGLPRESLSRLDLASRRLTYSGATWTPEFPEVVFSADASISIPGRTGIEVKTGWAEGRRETFVMLERVFSKLAELSACANSSCGLHVHLDAWNLNETVVAAYIAVWQALEKRVFDKVVDPTRINNRYCEFLQDRTLEYALLENPGSFPERARSLLHEAMPRFLREDRYRTLNTIPFSSALMEGRVDPRSKAYGTLEVRFLHVPRFRTRRDSPYSLIQPESAYRTAILTFFTVHGPYYVAVNGILNPQVFREFVNLLPVLESEVRYLYEAGRNGDFTPEKPPALSKLLYLMEFSEKNVPFELARFFAEAKNKDRSIQATPEETLSHRIKLVAWYKEGRRRSQQIQRRQTEQVVQRSEETLEPEYIRL